MENGVIGHYVITNDKEKERLYVRDKILVSSGSGYASVTRYLCTSRAGKVFIIKPDEIMSIES